MQKLDMFKSDLKNKYSFLTEYFSQGVKGEKLAHSLLFYGNDVSAQYDFALEIARLLNCKEDKTSDCSCLNCNWVRNTQHPAVLTVSKIDNKPPDDETKTVISIAQARMVKKLLMNTSDYHRVFIFCDAQIKDDVWEPMGLNKLNFQEETANSLLKIIEEPPENTTFFFLTRDKNDLIETIVSRSQAFFIPSYMQDNKEYSLIEDVFEDYPNIERQASFDIAQKLFELSKEHGADVILEQIQNFFTSCMNSNSSNSFFVSNVLRQLKIVEEAKKQIAIKINPQLVFEQMCLELTK